MKRPERAGLTLRRGDHGGRGGPVPRASHTAITADAFHLCMIGRDPELALACRAAHLTVADSMSVVCALRASGQRALERVGDVDQMARRLAAAETHRLRVTAPRAGGKLR